MQTLTFHPQPATTPRETTTSLYHDRDRACLGPVRDPYPVSIPNPPSLLEDPTCPATLADHRRAVERSIHTMRANLHQPLTLEDLASAACLSPYHFNRVFRRLVGIPPIEFLTALRFQTARQLLLSTPLSVTDICFAVGYTSIGSFTTRFTQMVGLSPRLLRQRARLRTPFPRTFRIPTIASRLRASQKYPPRPHPRPRNLSWRHLHWPLHQPHPPGSARALRQTQRPRPLPASQHTRWHLPSPVRRLSPRLRPPHLPPPWRQPASRPQRQPPHHPPRPHSRQPRPPPTRPATHRPTPRHGPPPTMTHQFEK